MLVQFRAFATMIAATILIGLCSRTRGADAIWKGGPGTWSTASSWSGGVAPNNGATTFDVYIDQGNTATSAVTFNSGSSTVVDSLTISAGDRLDFASNNGISINRSLVNAGTMSFINGFLSLGGTGSINTGAGTLISGGGTVTISNTSIANAVNWSIFRAGVIGSGTLTRCAGVDSGTLTANSGSLTVTSGSRFDNGGTVGVTNFGTMTVSAATIQNQGLFSATSGLLILNAQSLTNNDQGRFVASGGGIDLNVPYRLTRDDEFTINSGGSVRFLGGLTTNGRTFSPGIASFVYAPYLNNNGGTINTPGSMTIGNATNVGGMINLRGGGYGDVRCLFDNRGGTFSIASSFRLGNYGTFSGGTFTSTGGAALNVTAQYGAAVADVFNGGTINIGDNNAITGVIAGNGVVNFLPGLESLGVGTVNFTGAGTTTLTNSTVQNGYAPSGGSLTLVNDSQHTFSGYGDLLLAVNEAPAVTRTLLNRGTFAAVGNRLNVYGHRVDNSGTMVANADAPLRFFDVGSFTSSGLINVAAGGSFSVGYSNNGSTYAGTASIASIASAGTVTLDHQTATVGSISGGTLVITPISRVTLDAANLAALLSTGTVELSAGASKAAIKALSFSVATLDVNDRAVLIDYAGASPLTSLTAKLKTGSSARWQPTADAFYSTAAAANPNRRAVGIAELSALFGSSVPATHLGQGVDATTLVIRFTYGGDANLDGKVDVSDLGALASHWQQSSNWVGGDFNYDGVVNVLDLGILASDWQLGAAAGGPSFADALASAGLDGASVPEPALGAAGVFLFLRRRPSAAKRRSVAWNVV